MVHFIKNVSIHFQLQIELFVEIMFGYISDFFSKNHHKKIGFFLLSQTGIFITNLFLNYFPTSKVCLNIIIIETCCGVGHLRSILRLLYHH